MISLISVDAWKIDINIHLFYIVISKYLNGPLNFCFSVGGWQDGATAVCVWVLEQTVSSLSLFCCIFLCSTISFWLNRMKLAPELKYVAMIALHDAITSCLYICVVESRMQLDWINGKLGIHYKQMNCRYLFNLNHWVLSVNHLLGFLMWLSFK